MSPLSEHNVRYSEIISWLQCRSTEAHAEVEETAVNKFLGLMAYVENGLNQKMWSTAMFIDFSTDSTIQYEKK